MWYDLRAMVKAFDTHIHLDHFEALDQQLDAATRAGVGAWVVPGVAPASWRTIMTLAENRPGVYCAPGIHPFSAGECRPRHLAELRRLLSSPRAVAVGEVGLDRASTVPRHVQEDAFLQMLRLARDMDKPLLIHARQSTARILDLLQREQAEQVGGIFHAFSGSLETARRIIDSGFILGIGGVVTWQNARRLPDVVRSLPPEALVLETDAPFLTPEPHRGETNHPAYLALVAEKVARLRGWSVAETVRVTTENARRVLKL